VASEDRKAALPAGRVRTPAILQMEATECGAAALAIMLGYYGRHVPLAQLRRECGVSRDGSKASNIITAARAHGLQAKGFKKDLPGLLSLRYPYIVFWNFNHFLVVEGYRKGKVYLNDPGSSRRSVRFEEFEESYTGIVLAMEPGPEFQRGGRKLSVASGLRERLRGSAGALLMCMFAALLMVFPGIVYPALLQVFIDKVLIQGYGGWARPIIIGILLTAVFRGLLTRIQSGMLRRLQQRLATAFTSGFVWHLLRLPSSYYAQRYAGELSGRIELNDSVADVLSGRLTTSLIDGFMMVLYLLVMLQFDRVLTGIGVIFAGLNFVVLRWVGRMRVDGNNQLAHLGGKTSGVAISGLQTIRTIKASALESDFFQKWAGHFARLISSRQEIDLLNQNLGLLPVFLSGVMTILILGVGGFRVMNGALTIGQLVGFQALMSSFLLPVNSLVSLGSVMQLLETDLSRLDDVLRNPAEAEPASLAHATDSWPGDYRLTGRVELRNVSFGYNPLGAPLIEGLSVTIEPGERVAFVGASGSGKSTVTKLIAGLYEPASGEILFDDYPRAIVPREVLTNSLALVEQDFSLFEGTVSENITLWDGSIAPESITQACRDALLHDAISAMPGSYSSRLLEGAANLSGGQRQRLELARALASNPSILILDEATSALDAETERLIDQNLRRLGCTCLIAAHRLSTIRSCDEIIVLECGRVVERGRHDDLIRAQGEYARLLEAEGRMEVAL
jgi:ATP-binding cassette, subfamily C, bacterial